jgi:glycogen debranching enzyme
VLLATLFASRGTIQLTAGDEFGRTQHGNNNAYAQDNEITWLEWETRDTELEDFVGACAASRAATPILSDTLFLAHAEWYDLAGSQMTPEKWLDSATDGFEVHIPASGNEYLAIRVDRRLRLCTMRRGEKSAPTAA